MLTVMVFPFRLPKRPRKPSRLSWLTLPVFLAIVTVASLSPAADRVALVIGNHHHDYPADLPNAEMDAVALANRLAASGCRVFGQTQAGRLTLDPAAMARPGVIDADATLMSLALNQFVAAARNAEVALFYFAGHGLEVDGKNYLVATDTKLQLEENLSDEELQPVLATVLERETLPLNKVLREANARAIPGLKLIVLDCCRENPFARTRSWARKRAFGSGGLADTPEEDLAEGTMRVYSAGPGQESSDGRAGSHSPFARTLLDQLEKAPDICMLPLIAAVSDHLPGSQKPWVKFDGAGWSLSAFTRVPFLAGGVPPPPPPLPQPPVLPRGFTNSLGMKFVPVPGTDVCFCEHETRVQDYAAYAMANTSVDREWKDYEYEGRGQGVEHPVVGVSWFDAKAFCAWLSRLERRDYRLPADHEWSVAVGIGAFERRGESPKSLDNYNQERFPWGTQWPPPSRIGNYSSLEAKEAFGFSGIPGYRDGFAFTAPVKSYPRNESGLFDLGGNVWEWCEDRYSSDSNQRVLRGGAWYDNTKEFLRSARRNAADPSERNATRGFRVVASAEN